MSRCHQWLLFVIALLCIAIMSYRAVTCEKHDLTPLIWMVPVMAIMAALHLSGKEADNAE